MKSNKKKRNRKERTVMAEEKDVKEEIIEESKEAKEAEEAVKETSDAEVDMVSSLQDKVKEMEEQIASLKDQALRAAAETENYKKRLYSQKEKEIKENKERMVKALIPVLENFLRAIKDSDSNKDFDTLRSGVVLIEDQMLSSLKQSWGLELVDKKDVAFDPNDMKALMVQEIEGLKEETVIEIVERGYKLEGKVIKPAQVIVGKPKSN